MTNPKTSPVAESVVEQCQHNRAAKAPMDLMTWHCPDCEATIDFSDPTFVRVDTWPDGRRVEIPFNYSPTPAEDDTPTDELERGKDELRRLMESIWRAEYRKDAPNWQPLDDLPGMITQIDNMYAGVRQQRDEARWDLHNPPAATAGLVGELVEVVTRDQAKRFLETAARNWRHLGPLSNSDLDDVADALTRLVRTALSKAKDTPHG